MNDCSAAIPDVKIGAAWVSDRPYPAIRAVLGNSRKAAVSRVADHFIGAVTSERGDGYAESRDRWSPASTAMHGPDESRGTNLPPEVLGALTPVP